MNKGWRPISLTTAIASATNATPDRPDTRPSLICCGTKALKDDRPLVYTVADFTLAEDRSHCVCPAGKRLYRTVANGTIHGYAAIKICRAKQDRLPCERRAECLRSPDKTQTRPVHDHPSLRHGSEKQWVFLQPL